MKKAISIGLLIGGLILLYFGYDEYQSLGSEISRALGGSGSERSIWMMAGGAAAAVTGLAGLIRGKDK